MSCLMFVLILVIAPPQATSSRVVDQSKRADEKSVKPQTAPAPTLVNGQAKSAEEPQSITVKTLPPVTVVPPKRDWADWGYWVFSGLLVVVGGMQVWLLKRTLGAINEQAKLMERQAKATEDTVTATRDNASAAKDAAEAAKANAEAAIATVNAMKESARKELRARVFVASAVRLGAAAPGSFDAEITIKNFGKTPAYACTCSAEVVLRTNPADDTMFPSPRVTGQEPKLVLPPDGQIALVKTLPGGTFGTVQHSQVMSGSHAVYVYGEIHYRDGFKKRRTNSFLLKCCGPDYSLRRFIFAEKGNKAN